jgi:ubiquinone/menaquinone biosynthesis C-methylase UbiE
VDRITKILITTEKEGMSMPKSKIVEYWSKFANTIDEDEVYIVGESIHQALMERVSGESGLGELIELGCGAGLFTKVLAGNASHVMATDLSDEMLAMARTRLKDYQNVTVEKADSEKTAFPDGRFDSIFMANLVHVIENPSTTLQESYRILKDGGLLLIVDYTGYCMNWFELMKMGIRAMRKLGKPSPHAKGNLSPDGLRSMVESAGFKVEEVQLMGDKTKALYLRGRKR